MTTLTFCYDHFLVLGSSSVLRACWPASAYERWLRPALLCTSHCKAMHCKEFRSVEARTLFLHLWSASFKLATWSSFHSYFLVPERWTHLFHSVVLRFTYEATDWFNKHILSTSYRLYAKSWKYNPLLEHNTECDGWHNKCMSCEPWKHENGTSNQKLHSVGPSFLLWC